MWPQRADLRVLERTQVSPPAGAVAESILPLTYLDLLWVNGGSVERVFFYPLPCSTSYFLNSVVPILKSSLSLVLHQFYPLAGKIRRSPERPGEREGYEIHYADGYSVSFTVAELDGEDFDEVSGSHARALGRITPLLPPPPEEEEVRRPLALQVTVFPNQGMAIGVTVHHAACDGTSSMLFMSSWAAACARAVDTAAAETPAPPAPVHDRSLVADRDDLYKLFYETIGGRSQDFDKFLNKAASPDAVIRSFALGADRIRRLKEMVSSETKTHCSTIVATFAFVWACHVKAQACGKDKAVLLAFAAECRGRLQPPLPASYFGNCLSACVAYLTAGELTGEGGIVAAARVIGEAIEVFKKEPFEGLDQWSKNSKSAGTEYHSKPLSVAGSPRFRVYDVDFGWGRPKKVEVPSIARTGAISVAESRDDQGGVEIGFALPEHEMDEFEKHFSRDLKLLQ